jgi:hypothetical protein
LRFLDGRNVLVDYYVYREYVNFLYFAAQYLSVFEGGLEGMGEGIDLSGVVFEASKFGQQWCCYLMVAKRCCYVRSSFSRICRAARDSNLLMRVPSRTAKASLWRGSCRRTLRYSSVYV